jgi:hypothetical protein
LVLPETTHTAPLAIADKPEPVTFAPGFAMTPRMRRIQKALLAHRKSRREIIRVLRQERVWSAPWRAAAENFAVMLHACIPDFLGSRGKPINIAALESPKGLLVKTAIEFHDGSFHLEFYSRMAVLDRYWRLVIEPQEYIVRQWDFQEQLVSLDNWLSRIIKSSPVS